MRFRLSTLLLATTVGPPVLAVVRMALTQPGDRAITDFTLGVILISVILLSYFAACLIIGFLFISVVKVATWLFAKFQRR